MTTEFKPEKPHVKYPEAVAGLLNLISNMHARLEALEMQQNANAVTTANHLSRIENRLDVIEAWLAAEEEELT